VVFRRSCTDGWIAMIHPGVTTGMHYGGKIFMLKNRLQPHPSSSAKETRHFHQESSQSTIRIGLLVSTEANNYRSILFIDVVFRNMA